MQVNRSSTPACMHADLLIQARDSALVRVQSVTAHVRAVAAPVDTADSTDQSDVVQSLTEELTGVRCKLSRNSAALHAAKQEQRRHVEQARSLRLQVRFSCRCLCTIGLLALESVSQ